MLMTTNRMNVAYQKLNWKPYFVYNMFSWTTSILIDANVSFRLCINTFIHRFVKKTAFICILK